jgi:hypothetical protein
MKTKTSLSFLFCLLTLSLTFTVLVNAQITPILTVSTDKQTYNHYSAVTVSGTIQYNGLSPSDALVGLQIKDANQNNLIIRTIRTGTSTPFNLPAETSSAYLSNQAGQPLSNPTVQVGALGLFTMNLVNHQSATLNMFITINIYDSNAVPIGAVGASVQLLGDTTGFAVVSLPIPTSAHAGLAQGYANIYTTWPSSGGVRIAHEKPFQFTITGGIAGQGKTPTSSSDSGSYNLTFCLPKTTPDGTYSVYTSSSYNGAIGARSTTFTVKLVGDFTHNQVVDFDDLVAFLDSYIKYNTGDPL